MLRGSHGAGGAAAAAAAAALDEPPEPEPGATSAPPPLCRFDAPTSAPAAPASAAPAVAATGAAEAGSAAAAAADGCCIVWTAGSAGVDATVAVERRKKCVKGAKCARGDGRVDAVRRERQSIRDDEQTERRWQSGSDPRRVQSQGQGGAETAGQYGAAVQLSSGANYDCSCDDVCEWTDELGTEQQEKERKKKKSKLLPSNRPALNFEQLRKPSAHQGMMP